MINFDTEPKVILSASGMCDAGRIRHHLKHNLWRPESTVLFVGYQAVGTLGRILVDGKKEVKLFGEDIEVRADVKVLAGMSGHADRNGLLEWIGNIGGKPEKVFVVHGDDESAKVFTELLRENYGYDAYAPYSGTVYNMITGEFIYEATPVPVKKKAKRMSDVFARLVAAGQRLLSVIYKNEGLTNKDMAKFADQVNSLSDKWDR
jgi:metallo-beta-lactamase family protein